MQSTAPLPPASPMAWRFIALFFGLSLVAAGTFFIWALWRSYQRARETRSWTAVPCQIFSSKLTTEESNTPGVAAFRPNVEFAFQWQGEEVIGTKIRRANGSRKEKAAAQKLCDQFPVGSQTTCYVPPGKPSDAILQHDSQAGLYAIWFPALFVIGGLGIAAAAFHNPQKAKSATVQAD